MIKGGAKPDAISLEAVREGKDRVVVVDKDVAFFDNYFLERRR